MARGDDLFRQGAGLKILKSYMEMDCETYGVTKWYSIDMMVGLAACQTGKPIATEHGWRTSRVIATRYSNAEMGWNIGFEFPRNIDDADRAEVSEFFESKGGWISQGGGYPGAVAYVKFDGVTSKETANAKMLSIMPDLDRLMTDFSAGRQVHIVKPKHRFIDKHGKEWPECIPPDPDDPHGALNNNLNVNGIPYKCSIEGRWIVDEDLQRVMREYETAQYKFANDLTTRKMTHAELMCLDTQTNVFPNQTFYAAEKYAELCDMLVKQWELQHGQPLPLYVPLSRARDEYGRSPQEGDNKRAVENLIRVLQTENAK